MSEIGKALHAFQKEAPPIHLDATNPHFGSKFASLTGVVAAVRPVLNKHGLVYAQFPTNIDGAPALETMLIHAESGEDIAAVTPLILAKNDPQAYGSALTYARRYALLSILGLVGDEDDDANSAQPSGVARTTAASGRSNGGAEAGVAPGVSQDARPAATQQVGDARTEVSDPADVVIHWSKNKGKTLGELTAKQVEWYANEWELKDSATDEDRRLKAAAQMIHTGAASVAVPAGVGSGDLDDIPFMASEF